MVQQFILIKSLDEIVNIADIVRISYEPEEIDDNEIVGFASLEIIMHDGASFSIEDDDETKEATDIYLSLIKSLPNLTTI